MSILNPRQFFSRKPLPVYTMHPDSSGPVSRESGDVRSAEQKAADQSQFNDRGLPYVPRHRASTS